MTTTFFAFKILGGGSSFSQKPATGPHNQRAETNSKSVSIFIFP